MRCFLWKCLRTLSVILAASTVPLRAELTPEQVTAAQGYLKEFSSAEFAVRQKAVDDLVKLGPDVLPVVRRAMEGVKDAEIEMRCEMVIKRIGQEYLIGEDGKPISLDPGLISIDVKDAPLENVMKEFAGQSGNAEVKLAQAAKWDPKPVTLRLKDVPYWQAMDALNDAAGLTYGYDWQAKGVALYPGPAAEDVGASFGPVAVKVLMVTSTRQMVFRAARAQMGMGNNLQVGFQYFWEDRLPVIGAQMVFTRAMAADGQNVPVPNAGGNIRGMWHQRGNQETLFLGGLQRDVLGPIQVEGFIRLDFGIGRKESKISDVFAKDERKLSGDDLNLTVEKAEKQPDQIVLTVRGESRQPVFNPQGDADDFGLFLVDPKGKRYRGQLRSSSMNGLGDGRMQFEQGLYYSVPEMEGAWSLVFVSPESVQTREFPITLKDIPIP